MGQLAYHGGISRKLYTAGYTLFGRTRGGLAMGTIAACAGFAACCGSSPATSATMGSVAFPEMRKHGYADTLAAGCLAAGGTLGILIPPSVILIIYGIMTEESIGKLFLAGLLPGIFVAILYIIAIYIITFMNPNLGPAGSRTTFKQKALALIRGGGETLAIFVLIIGGLFVGFFTPSEAGAIGARGRAVGRRQDDGLLHGRAVRDVLPDQRHHVHRDPGAGGPGGREGQADRVGRDRRIAGCGGDCGRGRAF